MDTRLEEYKGLEIEDDFWRYTENEDYLYFLARELSVDDILLTIGIGGRSIKYTGYVKELHATSIDLEDVQRFLFVSHDIIPNIESYRKSKSINQRIMYEMIKKQMEVLENVGRRINSAVTYPVVLNGCCLPYKPRVFDVVLIEQILPIVPEMAEEIMHKAGKAVKHDGKVLSDFFPPHVELKDGVGLDRKFLDVAEIYRLTAEEFYNPKTLTFDMEKLNFELKRVLSPKEYRKVFNNEIRWEKQTFKCHRESEIKRLHELAGLKITHVNEYTGGMVNAKCRMYVSKPK